MTTTTDRIRKAYTELVAEPEGWIGMRRLREHLSDIPRTELDAALKDLYTQPGVWIEPEVNQKALTDADWDAAVRLGGEEKHLLSIIDRAAPVATEAPTSGMTVKQAAEEYRKSESTICRWCRTGKLQATKIKGRWIIG